MNSFFSPLVPSMLLVSLCRSLPSPKCFVASERRLGTLWSNVSTEAAGMRSGGGGGGSCGGTGRAADSEKRRMGACGSVRLARLGVRGPVELRVCRRRGVCGGVIPEDGA